MFEVYFQLDKEATAFCDQLQQYEENVNITWEKNQKWGSRIEINVRKGKKLQCKTIIEKALADVFIQYRESAWINQIIRKVYYFRDKEEIQRIADLTQSIISGEDEDLGQILKEKKPRNMLMTLLRTDEKDDTIHFDSTVQFRMQAYHRELIEVVGLAIDEFKREEDYQLFVQSLRDLVSRKESEENIVHVLQGKNFSFYKDSGMPYSYEEIKKIVKNNPLYITGLDEKEVNLTPLIAMAPKKIKIYGDYPSEPKTLTVINIFQEKVEFKPNGMFPFLKQKRI